MNWAYQSNSSNKEDTSNHFHIFVGDLSNEVNDEVLFQAFSAFGTISEARVMWDMKTGRSRGYGFVAFRDRADAEKALSSMDGEWLGSRAIRCNWANQKGQPSISQQQAMAAMGMSPATFSGHHQFPAQGVQSYEMVIQQTPQWQTTCYVGNLTPYTTQNDIVPLFQNFGYVVETRFSADRGFAFVKMDSHENAAMAICQLSGYNVNGRPLKCSVGETRTCEISILMLQSGERIDPLPASSSHSLQVLNRPPLLFLSLQLAASATSLNTHRLSLRKHLIARCMALGRTRPVPVATCLAMGINPSLDRPASLVMGRIKVVLILLVLVECQVTVRRPLPPRALGHEASRLKVAFKVDITHRATITWACQEALAVTAKIKALQAGGASSVAVQMPVPQAPVAMAISSCLLLFYFADNSLLNFHTSFLASFRPVDSETDTVSFRSHFFDFGVPFPRFRSRTAGMLDGEKFEAVDSMIVITALELEKYCWDVKVLIFRAIWLHARSITRTRVPYGVLVTH